MSKKYTTNFLEDTNGSTGSANQVLVSTAAGVDWVDGSGSGIIGGPYLKDTTDTFTGSLTIVGDIRGNGQQLVLNAGESAGYATGQTAELVYLNAEAGIQINSSPDNWASGWAGRNTAYINRADASSYLPGDLSIAAGSQLFLDGGGNTYIYQDVADRVRFFVGGAEFMRFTESTANDINFFHNTTISGDLTVSGGDITLGGATGRIQGIDTISSGTDAVNRDYVDTEIGNIPSGLAFEGNWNASTDTPTLAGTTQDNGKFWIVSVAGSTNLSGITDWAVGDWAIYVDNGAGTDAWQKVDNSSTLSGLGAAGKVAFWSTTSNVSFNTNFSYDGTYLTSPRIRVGDGTDGYFYSDSAGRTAFAGGDFYIQSNVNNAYNYATNNYHGNTSGDNQLFRGNPLSGNNWNITAAGAISASSTIYSAGGFLVPYAAATKKPMINLAGATTYGLWHTEGSDDIFSFDFGGVSKQQFFQSGNATFAGDLTVSGGDIILGGTGRIQGIDTVSVSTDAANKIYVDSEIATRTPLNDIRSLGTTAFTNGANPNITTAQVMAEIEADGGFDSYSSVFKTSWSYAGNYNLTDAGDFTETAGSSWITWTDNSSDTTRGNITALAIAPNSGGSAGGVFIYNDQGSSYSPGWRQVWTNTTDGAGSGLDADLLDGQQGSYYASAASLGNYLPIANPTFTGTLTGPAATITGNTLLGNSNGDYVHINDRLFVGATDSGNAEFWFGEGTTGDVNYGAHWHWDSSYTHKWFTVNNSTETLMMDYATNDASKVNWYRDIDIQDNDILIDSSHGFINSGAWTRNATPSGYIDFGPANTSHAHIYTDRPNFYFNKSLTVNGSSIVNQNDIRSKIFYDVDNTAYYADFGSGQIILGGTGRIQGVDTVSASTDAVNKAYVDNNAAPYVKFDRTGINASTYTMIATVNGDRLASIIKMTMTGTSGSVVFACTFDITVNHSQDIHVKSMNGDYTEVTLRITSNNNEDYSIEAKHNGSSTTTAEVCIFPLANEAITPTTTDPGYTGAEYEHTATEGWRFGGEDGNSESSNVIVDGRIGIGTTSPDTLLQATNTADGTNYISYEIGNNAVNANNKGGFAIYELGTKQATLEYYRDGSGKFEIASQGASNHISLSTTAAGATAPTERIRIKPDGNVGIGTTDPQGLLEVQGAAPYIFITDTTETDSGIIFRDLQAGLSQAAAIKFNSSNNKLQFYNNDTTAVRMTIDTAGNVGIGTTSPTSALGSTKVLDISSTGNGEVILDHTDAGTASDLGLYSWARNNDHLAHIKATCDGSTTAAFISFHAQPSGGSFSNAASNEKMRIKSNGYVGIGTTSPDTKLDVISGTNNGIRISATDTTSNWRDISIRSYVSEAQANAFGDTGSYIYTSSPAGTSTETPFGFYGATVIQGRDNGNGGLAVRLGNGTGLATRMWIGATGVTVFSNTVTATNFILSSDERLKENIEKACDNRIKADWKTFELKTDKGQKRYGVIAQELEENHPEFVREDTQGFKSVAYIDLLIAKIAELEARLEKAGI